MKVSHGVVARDLNVAVSTVSRLRSGHQLPSWETMINIANLLGWNVRDQAQARATGTWADEFEYQLRTATRWNESA